MAAKKSKKSVLTADKAERIGREVISTFKELISDNCQEDTIFVESLFALLKKEGFTFDEEYAIAESKKDEDEE